MDLRESRAWALLSSVSSLQGPFDLPVDPAVLMF